MALSYQGPGNVLICWEHHALGKIIKDIGVKKYSKNVPEALQNEVDGKIEYPDDRFDIIWTIKKPYDKIDSVTSEDVKGLDDAHAGRHRLLSHLERAPTKH